MSFRDLELQKKIQQLMATGQTDQAFELLEEKINEEPEFVGEIGIEKVTISLADFPYKIGPVNGTLFLEKDRIDEAKKIYLEMKQNGFWGIKQPVFERRK